MTQFILVLLMALGALLGAAGQSFAVLGNCAKDDTYAMRPVYDLGTLGRRGCYAAAYENCPDCFYSHDVMRFASMMTPPPAEYVEFDVFLVWQDDSKKSLYTAAVSDLKNANAKAEVQMFVRRLTLNALNLMVGKHNDVDNTFQDCNPGLADAEAKKSGVVLSYDTTNSHFMMKWRVHLPQYWVAMATFEGKGEGSKGITTPQGMKDSMSQGVFVNMQCKDKSVGSHCMMIKATLTGQLQTTVDAAARGSPQANSLLVKVLNPGAKTMLRRELARKSGKSAKKKVPKVVKGGAKNPETRRGP